MFNKESPLDIYLMGIGGTGMGAFAGLLRQSGHKVFGSDNSVYSPMKEKLAEWGIEYATPYDEKNLPRSCDLVIIGNVIRKDNPEAQSVAAKSLPYDSFPSALNKLFLQHAVPIVASGTHGKTTCSALLAHTLFQAGFDPGFLVGGIPINFGESFRASRSAGCPFVVEGDEYDTAYFDKRPKFIHYDPQFLLVTSLEFDHGDIYRDLDAVIDAFASLMKSMSNKEIMVINGQDDNIKTAMKRSSTKATIVSYGPEGDYQAKNSRFEPVGITFSVSHHGSVMGDLTVPLFGEHNLSNALGCYAILHQFGMSHQQIADGFKSFSGVKRRLEEKFNQKGLVAIDDFAHHPTAVKATIKAVRQKYPSHKVVAIFEPRSATSCMKVFEDRFFESLSTADMVMIAPVGRALPPDNRIDTKKICSNLNLQGINSQAYSNYEDLRRDLADLRGQCVLLFMSNGDFSGLLKGIDKIFA
jgi:UDP-N-acetylmuramate: L-alanyl-gamma-D-glutamyl-meso-diaminopimelate ligase